MIEKRFVRPVTVKLDQETGPVEIVNARGAAECLLMTWPAERGPRHRDAVDACLKVLEGHRSTADARDAFIAAAKEAGILVSDEVSPNMPSAKRA
jgi:hypothetical protein